MKGSRIEANSSALSHKVKSQHYKINQSDLDSLIVLTR
jgi:hypothetical protein